MNIQENNKMIAEFMGMKYSDERSFNDGEWTHSIRSLSKFQTSWDWLMPVVEKIENYLSENIGKVGYFDECLSSNDLDVRYQAVVEFINQYNKNK